MLLWFHSALVVHLWKSWICIQDVVLISIILKQILLNYLIKFLRSNLGLLQWIFVLLHYPLILEWFYLLDSGAFWFYKGTCVLLNCSSQIGRVWRGGSNWWVSGDFVSSVVRCQAAVKASHCTFYLLPLLLWSPNSLLYNRWWSWVDLWLAIGLWDWILLWNRSKSWLFSRVQLSCLDSIILRQLCQRSLPRVCLLKASLDRYVLVIQILDMLLWLFNVSDLLGKTFFLGSHCWKSRQIMLRWQIWLTWSWVNLLQWFLLHLIEWVLCIVLVFILSDWMLAG